ncbi:hypothetical protein ABI_16870 [Asticcacaulis biprosthecium C19]|uniref:Uncharacterized protein n=1 Tax=Asticcacaulis biprosthecium C19 TaxID=715226 RepID=F4QK69_9CAUL|nr:hypothetical protein ABI_16870 [Asticcacaulis biprosthecium C19]
MKRKRITWFDDWREWFGPRTYGIGWTVKTWKGAVAVAVVLCLVTTISVVRTYISS